MKELISIKLTPDQYTTEGILQLDDINQLFIRWHRTNNIKYNEKDKGQPTILKIGKFEEQMFLSMAWTISFTKEFLKTATWEEINKRTSEYWHEQWKKGNRYLPYFQNYNIPIKIELLDKDTYCELI